MAELLGRGGNFLGPTLLAPQECPYAAIRAPCPRAQGAADAEVRGAELMSGAGGRPASSPDCNLVDVAVLRRGLDGGRAALRQGKVSRLGLSGTTAEGDLAALVGLQLVAAVVGEGVVAGAEHHAVLDGGAAAA